jgi:hypothetical protein
LEEVYSIDHFQIQRDGRVWTLPKTAYDWMDEDKSLINGHVYQYEISGMNQLGQVVLHTQVGDTCDTGAAFIPFIDTHHEAYFLDSLEIGWHWKGSDGRTLDSGTRGADSCRIELSVSRSFPQDTRQTRGTLWFKADGGARTMRFHSQDFPPLISAENESLFFRITAKDPWGHPVSALWSTDFDPDVQFAVYDVVSPPSVTDLSVASVKAFASGPDTVLVELRWTGRGVEFISGSQLDTTTWTSLNSNVSYYQIMRKTDSGERLVFTQPVDHARSFYSYVDTIVNREYSWYVVCEDSAGNRTTGPVLGRHDWFIPTPPPPIPTGYRSCSISVAKASGLEFNVEIAMDSSHFRIGHEIGDPRILDTLICRSDWIRDTLYTCPTGWGTILTDSTWFRIKYRKGAGLESGWSNPIAFAQAGLIGQKPGGSGAPLTVSTEVFPNYPNPFNAETLIKYRLAESCLVEIHVYNIAGSLVRSLIEQTQSAGEHNALWDARDARGRDLASGVYFIRVKLTGKTTAVQHLMKTILVR